MFIDFSELKNKELEERITKARQMWLSANNESVAQQFEHILRELEDERTRRFDARMKRYYERKGITDPNRDTTPIDF